MNEKSMIAIFSPSTKDQNEISDKTLDYFSGILDTSYIIVQKFYKTESKNIGLPNHILNIFDRRESSGERDLSLRDQMEDSIAILAGKICKENGVPSLAYKGEMARGETQLFVEKLKGVEGVVLRRQKEIRSSSNRF